MKNIQILQEANFALYIKDIVLNLNDWVEQRVEGEVDDLTIELLMAELVESLCPIQVFLDVIPDGLFEENELNIPVPSHHCPMALDVEEGCVRITIDTTFKLNCVSEFSEDSYTAWRDQTNGFNLPALSFKFGEYEGDGGGDISPNFPEE